ncbi:hypothetical protein [Francisella persica]
MVIAIIGVLSIMIIQAYSNYVTRTRFNRGTDTFLWL